MSDKPIPPLCTEDDVHIVHDIYGSAWDGFHNWEQIHCAETLQQLAGSAGILPPSGGHEWTDPYPEDNFDSEDRDELFTVVGYAAPSEGIPASSVSVSATVIEVESILEPYPAYEACTPVNRNILIGDDPDSLPFTPLADDPTFDHAMHIKHYRYFKWQTPNRDPDLEVIVTEAAHRAEKEHGLSFEVIQETAVLPISLFPEISDILRNSRRRDFPKWPAISNRPVPIQYWPSYIDASFEAILRNTVEDFCMNINCILPYCVTHVGEKMIMPEKDLPTLSTSQLAGLLENPCGPDCCIIKPTVGTIATYWSPEDLQFLFDVLYSAPDASPCDLAIICRKPCREVSKHRQIVFQQVVKASEKASRTRISKTSNLTFYDHDTKLFTPVPPCAHSGPCNLQSNCGCFRNYAHCHMACRCDKKCTRRQGCGCSKNRNGRVCGTKNCACFVAHRECDPSLCHKCEAKDPTSGLCKNVSIQRGIRKCTEVRVSKWGLGLFMAEAAEAYDFIIEYTGEVIHDMTTLCREYVSYDPPISP